jgi:hypothetical protein
MPVASWLWTDILDFLVPVRIWYCSASSECVKLTRDDVKPTDSQTKYLTGNKRVTNPSCQALALKSPCAQNLLDFDLSIGQNGEKPAF